MNNPLVHSTLLIYLQHIEYFDYGVFELGNYHFQIVTIRDDKRNCLSYELIIADNSDGKKRMAVLTADGLESELIEMDSSRMRENVIIDLNEEGRRWEGGELNGKPFGFGREYSEDDKGYFRITYHPVSKFREGECCVLLIVMMI